MDKKFGLILVVLFVFSFLPANAESVFEKMISANASGSSYVLINDYKIFETRDGPIFFNKNKISCLFIREIDCSQISQDFRIVLVVDGKEFTSGWGCSTRESAGIILRKLLIYFDLCHPE